MPSNDRDVWVAIVSGSGQPELQYLTYAIYSFEKYEWYGQIEAKKGKPPTPEEFNDWISQITESRIKGWRESAAKTFDVAARTYMKDYIAQERQSAINDHVVTSTDANLNRYAATLRKSLDEFHKATSLGKQLLIAVIIAILSPIILGLLILAIQAADLWPAAVSNVFHPRPTETSPAGLGHKP
jgi:hypothetical protein